MRSHTSFPTAGVALLFASVLGTASCEVGSEGPVAGRELTELPADYAIYGMTTYMTTDGVRQGRIMADTAYMFDDSTTVRLHGIDVVFYSDNGTARGTVTAAYGEWNRQTNRMTARGDAVFVVSADGSRIESQELHYDPDLDRIWSDLPTTQTKPNGVPVRGSSFESDLEFTDVRIRGIGSRRFP
ncbi:MAG: LPS export ABC transporter periplasmic protein LptC [Gemmatimonadetes bacterium]|nr:LPS export ABC transporter periplasmic protein LptC [Gemmatimonadota bacterium]